MPRVQSRKGEMTMLLAFALFVFAFALIMMMKKGMI